MGSFHESSTRAEAAKESAGGSLNSKGKAAAEERSTARKAVGPPEGVPLPTAPIQPKP